MGKKSILLVEDEAVTAMDLKSNLIQLGYEVPAVVASGEDAIRAAAELSPDLVLMDITLASRMTGIETADEIRQSHAIPVVFLTAHTDTETIGRAAKTEPFGYLPKPCGIDTLMSTIEVALYKAEVDARRRTAENQLRRVQGQQRVILDTIGVGVLYLRNRKTIWTNPCLSGMFGYTAAEVCGLDTEMFYLDRATYETVGRDGSAALERGEIFTCEIPMRRKDGSPIWCHLVGQAVEGEGQENYSIWLLEDVTGRRQRDLERERLIVELQEALAKVKLLSGFIPICASCKMIRNDQGYWQQIEAYIRDHSEAEFSHGICPGCAKKLYGELYHDLE